MSFAIGSIALMSSEMSFSVSSFSVSGLPEPGDRRRRCFDTEHPFWPPWRGVFPPVAGTDPARARVGHPWPRVSVLAALTDEESLSAVTDIWAGLVRACRLDMHTYLPRVDTKPGQ